MALHFTVARPYAKALFNKVKLDPVLAAAWSNVLNVLAYIMRQQQLLEFTGNPKTTELQQLNCLTELVAAVVEKDIKLLGDNFENFLKLLIANKRLVAVFEIFQLFKRFVDEAQRVTDVTVTSAFDIELATQEKIKTMLAKRFNTKITATFDIDKSLIGGAVIRTDNVVIDGSIKGKLASLHQSLNS